ncbi:MAG: discoidin domain-containing protein [Alphaproteobacteria bacterium]|nr:discoidin domain-containing protein [Alphaproteobacteria bacterium]
MLVTLLFFYPSLISGSANAGFLYTGDITGFYATTVLKAHSLIHAMKFAAIDYSLFGGSSDFFISPNFYTFHPIFLIYYVLADPETSNINTVGQLTTIVLLFHSLLSMYFTVQLTQRLLGNDAPMSIFAGAAFTFTPLILGGLFQPEFLFSVLVLPWIAYACLSFLDRPALTRLITSSVPVALAFVGGYVPMGAATIALAAFIVSGHVIMEGVARSESITRIARQVLIAALPVIVGAGACAFILLKIFLYNKETSGIGAASLFYSAQQMSESPVALLRALSNRFNVSVPGHEFTVTLGVVPLLIVLIFLFSGRSVAAATPQEIRLMKLCAVAYGATLLSIFGVYSVVSDFVYYFIPQVGKMHIYQRFLWPANLALVLMITVMLASVVRNRDFTVIRIALLSVLGLIVATCLAVLQGAHPPGIELNGFLIVELLAGFFFIVALLLPGRLFPVLVAAAMIVLPAFDKMYELSDGGNTLEAQQARHPLYLDADYRAALVDFIKRNTTKEYIKYIDVSPMWGPDGIESFAKQFPYMVLEDIKLSSFGGFTFYLSARADYMKLMPIGAEVRVMPNFEILREAGVDFIVARGSDLNQGFLADYVAGVPESEKFTLPNDIWMVSLRSKLANSNSAFDNGMFRLSARSSELSELDNVAQGKPAQQSGTVAPAGLAVDGDTNGDFSAGSVAHTGQDQYAWLDVDLGESMSLEAIRLWNRTDCCTGRLDDFWLFVSDAPFAVTDTPDVLRERPGTWSQINPAPAPKLTVQTDGVKGRYVRVQLSGSQAEGDSFLNVAELEVFKAKPTAAGIAGVQTIGTVQNFSSNFANYSLLEVELTEPAVVTYLYWTNPRLSYWVNGARIQPDLSSEYPKFNLPVGHSLVEVKYASHLMVLVWTSVLIYWIAVLVSYALRFVSIGRKDMLARHRTV